MKKLEDEKLEKAHKIHQNKYDYSKVLYQKVKDKVEIICPIHGSFWQSLDNHINVKHGCPSCSNNKRKTTSQFIQQAKGVHGDRYDYSKTKYKSNQNNVTIICKEHGEFKQSPSSHLRGSNCPKCSNHYTLTTGEFIEEARKIHGSSYIYDKVDYKGVDKYIIITRPKHGDFKQFPYNHIRGRQGCPSCGNEKKGLSLRKNKADFIEMAHKVHPVGSFDYSEVEYEKNNVKVKITCKYGHLFYQTPANHLTGFGCPECALGWVSSGYYKTDGPAELYVLVIPNSFVKVGISKNFNHRYNNLKKDIGCDIKIEKRITGPANKIYQLEKKILRQSCLVRYCPEFSFSGDTECLELSELPKVLEIIENWKKENSHE